MLIGRRYLIVGRVQGIGFRYFAYETAAREGVMGFVRNLPDGTVEVVGEGDAEAMMRFEAAIRQGPAGARVVEVETESVPPSGRYGGFTIRR